MFLETSNEIIEAVNELTKTVSDLNSFDFLKDFCVPMCATLLGGLISFFIAWCTIKADKKQARQEYLKKIKPYLAIENTVSLVDTDCKINKIIYIYDDSDKEISKEKVYYLDFVVSNVGGDFCIFNGVKINSYCYYAYSSVIIKSGEIVRIKGFPISIYAFSNIDNLSLVFQDKQLNTYDYAATYLIIDYENKKDTFFEKYDSEKIIVEDIDCTSGIVKSKENIK